MSDLRTMREDDAYFESLLAPATPVLSTNPTDTMPLTGIGVPVVCSTPCVPSRKGLLIASDDPVQKPSVPVLSVKATDSPALDISGKSDPEIKFGPATSTSFVGGLDVTELIQNKDELMWQLQGAKPKVFKSREKSNMNKNRPKSSPPPLEIKNRFLPLENESPPTLHTTPQRTQKPPGSAAPIAESVGSRPNLSSGANNGRLQLLKDAVTVRSTPKTNHVTLPKPPIVPPKLRPLIPPHMLKAAPKRSAHKSTVAGSNLPERSRPNPSPTVPTTRPTRPFSNPTVAIIGDSIVKHISSPNTITHCFPGATTTDVIEKFPGVVSSLPLTVEKIVLHVGCNDTSCRRSIETQSNFQHLIEMAISCERVVYLSGPIPTFGRGSESFSRIIHLNSWLSSYCISKKVNYIDNFNLFWNRSELFSHDGLHPSRLGSRVLSDNLRHAVLSSPCTST